MKLDPRDPRRNSRRRKTPPAPWSILDVELAAGAPDIVAPAGVNALMLVFRFEGAVIGQDWIAVGETPLSGEAAAERARRAVGANVARLVALDGADEPAWTPARPLDAAVSADPFDPTTAARLSAALAARRRPADPSRASVVICTKGRPRALADCLRGIAPEIAKGRAVIVVDNGPDVETEVVVKATPGVRYVVEARPGVNRARNTGLAAASTDIVVYLDDDVVPEPGWVEAMVRRFDDREVACVCGLVLPHALDADSQIAFQFGAGFGGMGAVPLRFDRRFLEGWRYAVPVWEIGASANMAVSARHMRELGWLDERLGPGAAGGCGDDSEFWHRAIQSGFAVLYEPLAVVRHQHRADGDALRRQSYGYAMGHVLGQLVQYAKHGDRRSLWEVYWRRPGYYARRLLRLPDRYLRGRPDDTVWVQIRGHIAALAAIRKVLRQPTTLGRD